MGGERKLESPVTSGNKETRVDFGKYKDAYELHLIRRSKRNKRTRRAKDEVKGLSSAFSEFYAYARSEDKDKRYDTLSDVNRKQVHIYQASMLSAPELKFKDIMLRGNTVLDIGCGTQKIIRRFLKTPGLMEEFQSHLRKMRILGIDNNIAALSAAAEKRRIFFEHYPEVLGVKGHPKPSIEMDLLLLDLIDLDRLNLRQTCIRKEKVDLVLASDVFRWLRGVKKEPEEGEESKKTRKPEKLKERLKDERRWVLLALKNKLKEGGYLIIMEFTDPYQPTVDFLPDKDSSAIKPQSTMPYHLAMDFAQFYNRHEMTPFKLYKIAEEVGFKRVLEIGDLWHNYEKSPFPPLITAVFKLP